MDGGGRDRWMAERGSSGTTGTYEAVKMVILMKNKTWKELARNQIVC